MKNNQHLRYQKPSPSLYKKARCLRQMQTEAEKNLWACLRNRNLLGYKFRRQHPLLQYIVDFYCVALKLAIEIDGDVHSSPQSQQYDQLKSKELEENGITVIRFRKREVLEDLEGVIRNIQVCIESLTP